MIQRWRLAIGFLAVAGLAAAGTLKSFDGSLFNNVPVQLTNQLSASDGLTFDSTTGGACTASSCGFVVQNNASGFALPSGPNYVNIQGNQGVGLGVHFSGNVQSVSFETLGLLANSGRYMDGVTITFLDTNGNVIDTSMNGGGMASSWSINPTYSTTTNIGPQLFSFSSNAVIGAINFTKVNSANGPAMFAFDNFSYGTAADPVLSAVPEPGSLALLGAGLVGLYSIRRKFTRP